MLNKSSHSYDLSNHNGLNWTFYVLQIDFPRWLFILANCVRDESCREKIAPIYPKGPKFVGANRVLHTANMKILQIIEFGQKFS